MGTSDGKIVYGADVTAVISAGDKIAKKNQEIVDGVGKVNKGWQAVGATIKTNVVGGAQDQMQTKNEEIEKEVERIKGAWERVSDVIAKRATGAAATMVAMAGVALNIANEYINKVNDASKSGGANALSLGKSINQFGFDDTTNSALYGASRYSAGGASEEDRASAMGTLADWHRTTRRQVTPETAKRFAQLAASGIYTTDQLMQRIERNQALPTAAEEAAAFSRLPAMAQSELATASAEYRGKTMAEDSAAASSLGNRGRLADAAMQDFDIRHPLLTGAQGIPIIGGLVRDAERATMAGQAKDAGTGNSSLAPLIAEQNRIMRNDKKLNMSAHSGTLP